MQLLEAFLDPSMAAKRPSEWRTSLADLARVYSAQLVLISFCDSTSTGAICEELPKKLRENFVGRCTVVGADTESEEAKQWCAELEASRVHRRARDIDDPELSFRLCHWRGRASGSLEQALVCGTTTTVAFENMQESQAVELDGKDARVRMVVAVSIDGEGGSCKLQDAEQERIPLICRSVVHNVKQKGYVWASLAMVVWCHFPSLESLLESLDGHRFLNVDRSTEPCGFAADGTSLSFGVQSGPPRLPKAASTLRESVQSVLDVGLQMVSESSFFTACQEGDLETVSRLLRREPKLISAIDPYGATGLICAAIEGIADVVAELLRHGADPNATDAMGATALAAAVCTGRVETVEHLVKVTAERKVPAGNIEAWANDAVLVPLGVQDSDLLDATKEWDMVDLTHEMVVRLERVEEKELCDAFKEIADLLDNADPAAVAKSSSLTSRRSGHFTSLEEQEETITELRRQLQELQELQDKSKCNGAKVNAGPGKLKSLGRAGPAEGPT